MMHPSPLIADNPVKRLLVRGPNWIGDAVMCEPAVNALRRRFPQADITLLVKPAVAELFAGHPGFDRILTYEARGVHAGLFGKWTLANRLRRQHFDLAVLFQNAFEAALLAFFARIPRRYGYATDGRGLLLTDPIPVPDRAKTIHQVQYYLDLLGPLGALDPPSPPRLFVSEREEQDMAGRLAEAGIGPESPVVGLNPGSTYGGAKRWLPERFAEAADRLVRERRAQSADGRRDARVIIVGARGEEELGKAIADRMYARTVVLSGRTSIRELMAVIKRCEVFLTNDTGPMHMAAALGVPVVATFGPTDHRTTAPFGGMHTIVRHPVDCSPCLLRECPIDHRCMTGITAEDVSAAAIRLLKTTMSDEGRTTNEERPACKQDSDIHHSSLSLHYSSLTGVTVFLDRDGTLNRDIGYVRSPDELELLPGAAEAVARLNRAGARIALITNQSGVARGFFTTAGLDAIHARLRALLAAGGAFLDGIYYCPHHPDDGCACRKPGTALAERAFGDLEGDRSACYMVGDQKRDVELARKIGARSVLVTSGQTSLESLASLRAERLLPDHVAAGLAEAVGWIFEDVARSALRATRT
jgi:heptosyltransferase-2